MLLAAAAPAALWIVDLVVSDGDDVTLLSPDYARTHGFAFVVEGDPEGFADFSYEEPPSFYIYPDGTGYAVAFQWLLTGPVETPNYPSMYLSVPADVTNVHLIDYTLDTPQNNQRNRLPGDESTAPGDGLAVQKRGGRNLIPIDIVRSTVFKDAEGKNLEEKGFGTLYIGVAFGVPDARVEQVAFQKHRLRIDYAPIFAADEPLNMGGAEYFPVDPLTGRRATEPAEVADTVNIYVCVACEGDSSVNVTDVRTRGRSVLREEEGFLVATRDVNEDLTLMIEVADKRWDALRGGSGIILLVVGGAIGAVFGVVYRPSDKGGLGGAESRVTSRRI